MIRIIYLVKYSNHNNRQSSEENIIQWLEPIIVEPLAWESRVQCEPELCQSKR